MKLELLHKDIEIVVGQEGAFESELKKHNINYKKNEVRVHFSKYETYEYNKKSDGTLVLTCIGLLGSGDMAVEERLIFRVIDTDYADTDVIESINTHMAF